MNRTNRTLALAGMTAALYVALTMLSSSLGLAYGPVQVRISEALTVLPWLFPGTGAGLIVGCLLANLFSPYGLVDLLVGTTATAVAVWLTARVKKPFLAPLPPVLCNMILVGIELAWYEVGFTGRFLPVFGLNALWVGIGEVISCCLLGGLLLKTLPRIPALRPYLRPGREELAERQG